MNIAFDTETALITETVIAPPLVCTTWANSGQQGIFKWNGEGCEHWGPVVSVLKSFYGETLVGANTAFDTVVHLNAYPELVTLIFQAYEEGRIRDVQIRDKLINNALGCFRWKRAPDGSAERVNYHLTDLTDRWLGYKLSKGEDTWRLRYIELHDVPLPAWPADATGYAIKDARSTLDVHDAQERFDADFHARYGVRVLVNEADQCRAAFALQLIGAWGMKVIPEKAAILAEKLREESEEIRTILTLEDVGTVEKAHEDCEHEGCIVCAMLAEITTNDIPEPLIRIERYKVGARKGEIKKYTKDTEAARARLLAVRARAEAEGEILPPIKMTKGGEDGANPQIALDKEACEDSGDPILQGFAEYTKLGSVLNKDVPSMLVGEIHGSFDPLVATGRTACRGSGVGKKKGMQIQNPSRKAGVRECFGPRDGFDFCFIDLDTAELRAFAQVCINLGIPSRMAQALNAGQDPHLILAATIMGISYEEILARHAAGDPVVAERRQIAKNCNFGFLGGMGWRKFRTYVKANAGIVLTEAEAKYYRAVWLATWPEAKAYFDYHSEVTRTTCTVVQHYSGRIRGGLTFSESANTLFQGLIADAIKAAMWRICRAMYDPSVGSVLYGSRMVNMIHDELICEVPRAVGHECALEIQRIVLEETGKYLPNVPPRASPYLSRYWSKKAFAIKDVNGRYVAWNGQKKAA